MTTREEIAARLDDFAYQKKHFGGFMMNKRAKSSHALWTSTTDRGVTELSILTTRDYGDSNVYDVAAFRLDGPVPADVAAQLVPAAGHLADGANLRAHGYVYSEIEPWDGGGTSWISKKPEFRNLSRVDEGLYVIPIQRLTGDGEPHWLAWVRANGTLNIAIVYNP
ncbi:hypothetical protein [Humibacter ginsenosidimutans]|uniref:Uncharacterized protein n=1 Tax=Humibacter ginsenosidimutans TaxID=2599293 RepID=A0A5B8M1F2_9MICO|nr:hypothetical protein [Humibacter ginsenosidimutans]QDZ14507.1 hypothetical protein FPZ11_06800 [Humibacter ginsenosidimutans]